MLPWGEQCLGIAERSMFAGHEVVLRVGRRAVLPLPVGNLASGGEASAAALHHLEEKRRSLMLPPERKMGLTCRQS